MSSATFCNPPLLESTSDTSMLLKRRMRHTRMFILALAPFVMLTSPSWPEHSLPHEIMEWAGHVLVVIGVMIRIFASLYIGGRKNDDLVSDGPFSIVRNPLYVGSFIAVLGIGLLAASITITTAIVLMFVCYYKFTVAREELFLHRKFNMRYKRYANRVPRWLPQVSLWQNPGELNVKPYFVLRAILDGAVFFLVIPILEMVCELHAQDILPTLLTLP